MSQGDFRIGMQRRFAAIMAFACVVALFLGSSAKASTFFDFTTDPVQGNPAPVAGFTPAPRLTDASAPAVNAFLSGQSFKAVTVANGVVLSPSTISTIYGSQVINYTFSDFEGASAMANTVNLRNAIAGGPGNALPTNVYYGNYDLYPIASDPTRPAGYIAPGYINYVGSKVNIASESLYPGSWMFRTKTDNFGTTQSNAPNIVSALFTMPITRFSLTQAALPLGHKHIPYINRFNNYGNNLLNDAPNAQNPYRWSNPSGDQMLSRGDFKAMVAHYRMRGADGLHLLDGGVEGYSKANFEQDAVDGWNVPQINAIFTGGNAKLATLDTTVNVGGNVMSLEDAGLVFSGVYSLSQNGGKGKLALLVSNMSGNALSLQLSAKIGGKAILNLPQISNGHNLLEFTGAGTQWQLASQTLLFTSGIETDRSGVGVPEPTMMGGVALLALFGLARRRRN